MQSVSRMTDADMEAQIMGSASSRRTVSTMDEKHRDQLRKLEKERKDAQEVCNMKTCGSLSSRTCIARNNFNVTSLL